MTPYEALYGWKCRTPVCWMELNEHNVIGQDIVKDMEKKVQVILKRLKATSDRQKSYAKLKGKLSSRFTGPYEVLERIGPMAYRSALPPELAKLHDVFHVSMLRRYRSDESHILPVQEIQVQEDFSYDEEPKAILDREVRQLRNKQVPLVKVLWQHHGMEETTWEPEATMKAQYPQLFTTSKNFEDKISLRGGGGGGGGGGESCNTLNYTMIVFITCLGYNKSKCIFFLE